MNEQQTNGALAIVAPKMPVYADEDYALVGLPPENAIRALKGFCKEISGTPFLPKSIVKGLPEDKQAGTLLAVLLTGREQGFSPMQSLRVYWMSPDGRLGLYADAMMAKMLKRGLKFKWNRLDNEAGELYGDRGGGNEYTAKFSINDAKMAELLRPGGNYYKYPKRMIRARCISELYSGLYPDLGGQMPAAEELMDMSPGDEGPYSPREIAEAAADRKAEEDPAFAITPKAKPATEPAKAQVIDLPPAESRMEAFLKEQERKNEKAEQPVCEICGGSDCEHMPDPNAKPPKRETKEEKKAPAPEGTKAEREALKTRALSMAKGIEGATAKMIGAFIVGYYSEHPDDAKDVKKVAAALDALEAKLKASPKDSVALTVDADAFGKYLRQHGAEQPAQSDSQFPAWSEGTVKIAHACMKARNFDDKRFSTVLKSFGIDKMPEAEAQAALKLYLPTPDGFLLVRRAKSNRDLDALGALEMVEKELGHPIATVAHSEVVKAITNALSEVTA